MDDTRSQSSARNAPRTAPTLEDLRARRDEIYALAARYGVTNIRVFGSVARGEATPDSDIDLLVDFSDQATIWDAVGLWRALSRTLEREVNVIAADEPTDEFMRAASLDAQNL